MKMEIYNVKKFHPSLQPISVLVKLNPDFYEYILEAAKLDDLWGLSFHQNQFTQLEFDLNFSESS